jgi:hypothetical protein
MGVLELLFIALLVGKLAGWFAISWFWVIAPLIPALIIYAIVFGLVGITGILAFIEGMGRDK